MISDERRIQILENWERLTQEEKDDIKRQAEQLRAEAANWGPFYHWQFCRLHEHSGEVAFAMALHAKNGFVDSPKSFKHVKDIGVPAFEVEILNELRSPEILALNRICSYLDRALCDPIVNQSFDAIELIESWFARISETAFGLRSSDEINPNPRKIAKSAISRHSAENAANKNSEPREWVREQWKKRTDLKQSKASFARQYVHLVKDKYKVKVTAETIARDWLPKSGG